MKKSLVSALALLVSTAFPALAQNGKPDAEGYLRDWLILAPVPIADSGGDEIDRKQLATEASPAAKDGAVENVGGKEYSWKKAAASDFYLDFKALYPERTEQVIAWAVAYVVSSSEKTGLTLKMNSNDQGKVYLNGKEVVKFTDTRSLEKGAEDSASNVTLKKGVNIVVLKVINEENNWQGSLRFVDAAGKPVTDLKVETKP